jgi:hypothetical protein
VESFSQKQPYGISIEVIAFSFGFTGLVFVFALHNAFVVRHLYSFSLLYSSKSAPHHSIFLIRKIEDYLRQGKVDA